jgi:hypothetical protein
VYFDAASVVGKPFRYGAFEFTPKSAVEPDLSSEVRALRAEVRGLAEAIRGLREQMADATLVIRDVPREDAKREVAGYLKDQGRAFPSDISDALRLDYDLVVDILTELQREGRVELDPPETSTDAS